MATERVTRQGECWDAIAYDTWGDEHGMGSIVAANPAECDALVFDAGVTLTMPDRPASTNTADLPPWRQ